MADYIDRDELRIVIREDEYSSNAFNLMDDILSMPTVDAVEVVRCKNCKHRYKEDWCTENNRVINDNDFCKWGEKE